MGIPGQKRLPESGRKKLDYAQPRRNHDRPGSNGSVYAHAARPRQFGTGKGKSEGRSQKGGINIWPIDILTKGDIYVADGYGKIKDGTLIGSSLGNAIYGKTGKGVIFYGSVRDMQELKDTKGFNAWVKGHDPSYIKDMTPTSINAPIRIGEVTVLPGDVVFANEYGTVFIPAHLVEGLVSASEMTALRDEFERVLLQQGKYPSGEIHGDWSDKIKGEFRSLGCQISEETSHLRKRNRNLPGKRGPLIYHTNETQ